MSHFGTSKHGTCVNWKQSFALTDFSLDELLMYDTQIRLSGVSNVSRWIRMHTNQCKIA